MQKLSDKILHILRTSARLTDAQIAAMLGVTEQEVNDEIKELEDKGIIAGYTAIINEEKYDVNAVIAMVHLKVSPQPDKGYSAVAAKIAQFREVESVHLMSGNYDLAVTVRGGNLREVAMFVADHLAVLDGVLDTTTLFTLKRFKEHSEIFTLDEDDERGLVSP